MWQCRPCRKQFSVLTNTVMHGTKVPVRTWLMVLFEMCASKNGVSARELERKYGLCPRTAWYVAHRVREAMRSEGGLLYGSIVSDETWIGGDPKNRHKNERRADGRHRHALNKTPVISLICRETGEVRSKVVANVTGDSIYSAIKPNVSMRYSHLQTDEARGYSSVSWLFGQHTQVNHLRGEYVAAQPREHEPEPEGYFAQLKRSLDGTHHHVSREHLERYVTEFDFRYTTQEAERPRADAVAGRPGRQAADLQDDYDSRSGRSWSSDSSLVVGFGLPLSRRRNTSSGLRGWSEKCSSRSACRLRSARAMQLTLSKRPSVKCPQVSNNLANLAPRPPSPLKDHNAVGPYPCSHCLRTPKLAPQAWRLPSHLVAALARDPSPWLTEFIGEKRQ